MKNPHNEVDQYIAGFPKEVQTRLQTIRQTIRQAAPDAEECISYGIAAYKLFGALVYFAGYKAHIGFYPVPSGMKAFEKDLAPYAASKATAQFRHNQPIPHDLIAQIVKYRVQENREKAEKKKAGRQPKDSFLSTLSAPARRALEANGITTIKKLAKLSEGQVLAFHGMGPGSLPKLKKALQAEGLSFQQTA